MLYMFTLEPKLIRRKRNPKEQAEHISLMIQEFDTLRPFDPKFNAAIYFWQEVAVLDPEDRCLLLDALSDEAIRKLWQAAGQRYMYDTATWNATLGSDFDPVGELRGSNPGEPLVYSGRAAGVPTTFLNRFQKAFIHDAGTDDIFGRVLLGVCLDPTDLAGGSLSA
ncbi:hypothetical protein CYMTET_47807 [Cymbomonas tetramitiformis]|uniref:Uncharacterized protein n=1 Tax=Cymbomonas tetramitiformis TaxID=36881 RepID=A0AAE0EVL0_9CHLO|nr:hypothetical protein CYMTET_47807 [Cymbomonas tetramitiformis]